MLRENVAMGRYCSLRAGGIARAFFEPQNKETLCHFLRENLTPTLPLGLGSNLLFKSERYEGVVVKFGRLKDLFIEDGLVHAEAGTPLVKISQLCERQRVGGAEFLLTIPGSLGGALAMNAGAYGNEIWDFVQEVRTVDKNGCCHQRLVSDFEVGYRSVKPCFSGEFFLGATLRFNKPFKEGLAAALLAERKLKQPWGKASCGSVFKNPKGYSAGRLIEECGLKGRCIGGAVVSTKHANFIINAKQATNVEIVLLINEVEERVKKRFGVKLEKELILI